MTRSRQHLSLFVLWAVAVVFVIPLAVTLTNAFMDEQEINLLYTTSLSVFDVYQGIAERFVRLRLIPQQVSWSQFRAVLVEQPLFLMLMLNSVRITLPVVVGNVVVSLLCAYGFTTWSWQHKDKLFVIYLVVMLMPLQAVLVPNFIIADQLGLTASIWAIILPGIFAPFGTFILRQSMKGLPLANWEAARIDGANEWQIFCRIIVPQLKSGIAALMMLTFIDYWNVVEQAVIFIRDYRDEPLSVFLSRIGEGQVSLVFAASVVYMVIPFVWLLLAQKDLQTGIELSGVK